MGKTDSPRYLTFREILFVVLFAVAVPVTLVTSAGIVVIILGRETVALVTGILVVSFAAAVFSGVFVILLLLRRGVRLAREQETFLSNMTHELRTPLTAIRMYAQTLRMGRVSDQKRVSECLDMIINEAERLERLVNRVLQWRRIAEGKQVYQRRPALIDQPVNDALDNFKAMVGNGDVDLRVDVESAKTPVEIDRAAVADVVLNLLSNAFNYTGTQKKISVQAKERDGGVEVSVSDNGIGISEEVRERVFDRFYRGKHTSGHASAGVGLGLAIVRHVMDHHGGTVELVSEEGKGCVFKLFFPGTVSTGENP